MLQAVPTGFVIVTLGFSCCSPRRGMRPMSSTQNPGTATEGGTAALRRTFGLDLPEVDQPLAC